MEREKVRGREVVIQADISYVQNRRISCRLQAHLSSVRLNMTIF